MTPRDGIGTTDTISSLALVACCVISAMVLISSISYAFGKERDSKLRLLTESGSALFKRLLDSLTEIGCDGIRYLRCNWEDALSKFTESEGDDPNISCTITVRIFQRPDFVLTIGSESRHSSMTKDFAAPALLITGHSCLPTEIRMVVGI